MRYARVRRGRLAALGSRWAAACLAAGLAALAGCSAAGGSPGHPPPATRAPSAVPAPGTAAPARARRTDWTTYHHDPARTGFAAATPPAGRLSVAWRARLDGAVYGQPLAVGQLIVAATENDTIYGLSRDTGRVRWRAHVGTPMPLADLPCGDINPLGITGTPVYDRANGLVYAVAETSGFRHVLVGVSAANGAVRLRRDLPTPDGHPRYDQQRAALLLSRGRVYVAFGGLEGDCGPYRGSVVGVPVSGAGRLVSYLVPAAREGGIWAPGGPVAGPGGAVYVSIGNGAATGGRYDGSDSVAVLTPALRRTRFFAPATWAADNAGDLDLGSSSPALLPGGRLLAVGKRGEGYLLDASRPGGIGGELGQAPVCPAFGGMAVQGSTVFVPCASGGPAAVEVAHGRVRVRWRGPAAAQGSPVLGGGAVWAADPAAGILYELSPATGSPRQHIRLGVRLPHFASPTLSGRLAVLGAMNGVVAVRGAAGAPARPGARGGRGG